MKKLLLIIFMIINYTMLFSLEIPDSLCGIWEGKDRFVFFENQPDSESPEIVIILKTYYGWYYDRAAEPSEYKNKEPRTRNNATYRNAEHITFELNPISRCLLEDNVWELTLRYTKKDVNFIPIAIIDNKMYLNFFIKDIVPVFDENNNLIENENPYNGLWRGNISSEGIKICSQEGKKDIGAYYIWDDKLYDIRYWRSDMDFSSDEATYKKDDVEFKVDKHLYSAGQVYSCTSGRSKIIRNPVSPFSFKPENYIFDENHLILVTDKEPYLVKLADKQTMEDLMDIVKTANAKRKPQRKPLFDDPDLDWHWDLIDKIDENRDFINKIRMKHK